MEEISFNGEKYLKASLIADKFGYTADYVGQLCRAKQVKATLVGRSWYVNEESVREHKKGRHRSSLAKNKEVVRKATMSSRVQSSSVPQYLKRIVNYEQDEAELLPTVKKVSDDAIHNKSDNFTTNVVKTNHVTRQPVPKSTEKGPGKGGYHPAVRIIKATDNMAAASAIKPTAGQLSHTRRNRQAKRSAEISERKVNRARRRSGIGTILLFTILILVMILTPLMLEKQLKVAQETELQSIYQFVLPEAEDFSIAKLSTFWR